MTDRFTDEQVARVASGTSGSAAFAAGAIRDLAREVQEYRALRPPCPTCDGSGKSTKRYATALDHRGGIKSWDYRPCDNCDGTGLMPLADYITALRTAGDEMHALFKKAHARLRDECCGDCPMLDAMAVWAALPKGDRDMSDEPIAFTFYEVAALAHGAWDAEYVNWVLWERTCFPMDGGIAMRQMHAYLIDPAAGEAAFADYEERMLAWAAAGDEHEQ